MKQTTFGKQLRIWRGRAGLDQVALGKKAGFPANYISRVERGVLPPPRRAGCQKIAEALSLDSEMVWRKAMDSRLRLDPELSEFVDDLVRASSQGIDPATLVHELDFWETFDSVRIYRSEFLTPNTMVVSEDVFQVMNQLLAIRPEPLNEANKPREKR